MFSVQCFLFQASPLSKQGPIHLLNQHITPAPPFPQPNHLTPISEHTSLKRDNASGHTDMTASFIEHKRQVSVAVDLIHADKKKRKKLKRKKLLSEDALGKERIILREPHESASKQVVANVHHALKPTDHTPFTAEPHPLITSADLSTYSNGNNNAAADVSSNLGKLANAMVGVARGVVTSDEDHEYFSELVDNINKRCRYPAPSVSKAALLHPLQ